MSEVIELIFTLGLAIVLASYLVGMMKSGQAVGLFFDFSRDLEPIRYWLWTCLMVLVVVGQIWLAVSRTIKFVGS